VAFVEIGFAAEAKTEGHEHQSRAMRNCRDETGRLVKWWARHIGGYQKSPTS
jgi:hypothetical protein